MTNRRPKVGITFVILILMIINVGDTSRIAQGYSQIQACTGADVCEAIVFNQMAVAELQTGMFELFNNITEIYDKRTTDIQADLKLCEYKLNTTELQLIKTKEKCNNAVSCDEGYRQFEDERTELELSLLEAKKEILKLSSENTEYQREMEKLNQINKEQKEMLIHLNETFKNQEKSLLTTIENKRNQLEQSELEAKNEILKLSSEKTECQQEMEKLNQINKEQKKMLIHLNETFENREKSLLTTIENKRNQLEQSELKAKNEILKLSSEKTAYQQEMEKLRQINREQKKMLIHLNETFENREKSLLTTIENERYQLEQSLLEAKNEVLKLESEKIACQQEVEKINLNQINLENHEKSLMSTIKDLQESSSHLLAKVKSFTTIIKPQDCADVQYQGETANGIYDIYPYGDNEISEVYCDLESSEGGWTVFFHNANYTQPISFDESWENFKNGFGDLQSAFWLGNDLISTLTSQGASTLRMYAEDFLGNKKWGQWNIFKVDNEHNKYQLTVDDFDLDSIMGNVFNKSSGSKFTTRDSDNDQNKRKNCATGTKYTTWGKGGFWYSECFDIRLTEPIQDTSYFNSACVKNWDISDPENTTSLMSISLMTRRHNFKELSVVKLPVNN